MEIVTTLRDALTRIPDPDLTESLEPAIADSARFLGSDAAMRSLDADTYWPKWDSPWWHMLLLHELGEARRIPARAATKMAEGLDALPIKIFPIRPEDSPAGADPYRDSSCHCALGCIYQVLAACGLDVDHALPWAEPWFVRYQLADGGLNCDSAAYLQTTECPSSMVGTIAPFEAMLLGRPRDWTRDRREFVERAARFLVGRELRLGSRTRHNAEEREAQARWLQPCFPRFYFYDVVRGLGALVRWAELTGGSIPTRAIAAVVDHLAETFPDGVIRLGRRSYEGATTMLRTPAGEWVRRQPASSFTLLDATSAIGRPCPYTTRQWSAARHGLLRLIAEGRVDPLDGGVRES